MDEIRRQRIPALKRFVEQSPVVLVQKDARTIVGKAGRQIYMNGTGNAAMAKAGSGDVLAGMITGLAAQGMTAYEAAVLGVYLHGLAGDEARNAIGEYSVMARDLIDHISAAVRRIRDGKAV